jgi:L-ascorbate metabolism protein UlaG (beta-lactamase superfamily)
MKVTLDWLGCATFRLTIDETVVFLDAYMDRVPTAPPVGLTTAQVDRADFVLVGHSHFDHIAGADVIARNTGARVIGSHESCRVVREQGVDASQLLPAQGGERFRLSPYATVRVLPSLHSCIWTRASGRADGVVTGDLGLCEDERASVRAAMPTRGGPGADPELVRQMQEHLATSTGSRHIGGALAYLIETPVGSIFYQDTSGCWTGVLAGLRPTVAILAAAGRGNIDGEPIQGTLAQFVGAEAKLLQPNVVVLGHHDNWMPPSTREGGTDIAPIRDELRQVAPASSLIEPGYLEGTVILGA